MKSPDLLDIYLNRAAEYEELVAREDYLGHILPALYAICDLNGRIIVDLGTGTGRLMRLFADKARKVYGFDRSPAMLAVAKRELQRSNYSNWLLATADSHHLPLPDNCCDTIISGWSLCYLALDQGPDWQVGFKVALRRIQRLLRPSGSLIILETMGTGFTKPNPPSFMVDYFIFLEQLGMTSTWIRTDYRFESLAEAITLTRFFFGDELAQQVEQSGSPIVPECTGIWWSSDVGALKLDG